MNDMSALIVWEIIRNCNWGQEAPSNVAAAYLAGQTADHTRMTYRGFGSGGIAGDNRAP